MLKSTKKQLTRSTSEGNEYAKNEMKSKPKSIAAIREDEDWKSLLTSITLLFTEKRLQRHELDILNEKVRKIRDSKIEADVLECFKDSILKKGGINFPISLFYCIGFKSSLLRCSIKNVFLKVLQNLRENTWPESFAGLC